MISIFVSFEFIVLIWITESQLWIIPAITSLICRWTHFARARISEFSSTAVSKCLWWWFVWRHEVAEPWNSRTPSCVRCCCPSCVFFLSLLEVDIRGGDSCCCFECERVQSLWFLTHGFFDGRMWLCSFSSRWARPESFCSCRHVFVCVSIQPAVAGANVFVVACVL